jgi:hypothetical protein
MVSIRGGVGRVTCSSEFQRCFARAALFLVAACVCVAGLGWGDGREVDSGL